MVAVPPQPPPTQSGAAGGSRAITHLSTEIAQKPAQTYVKSREFAQKEIDTLLQSQAIQITGTNKDDYTKAIDAVMVLNQATQSVRESLGRKDLPVTSQREHVSNIDSSSLMPLPALDPEFIAQHSDIKLPRPNTDYPKVKNDMESKRQSAKDALSKLGLRTDGQIDSNKPGKDVEEVILGKGTNKQFTAGIHIFKQADDELDPDSIIQGVPTIK